MFVSTTTPVFTMDADDFYEFVTSPENRDRSFELVRGKVIELPLGNRKQGRVCAAISFELNQFARRREKGYVVSNESGVILERDPYTVRGPDVAYYEDAATMEDLAKKWADVPPRVAVEILSPNDTAQYITVKINDYLDNGVDLVWVIDPELRTISVYGKTGVKKLTEKDTLTCGDVLPGFRCKVANLFVLPEAPKKPRKKGT